MQNTLREALQACATFNIVGDQNSDKVVAFLPGIYNTTTEATVTSSGGGTKTVIAYTDPSNLNNAGYQCNEVADDYINGNRAQSVHITGANRVRYRDFLNTVQRVGINVTKIVFQNNVTNDTKVFNQEIQLARTAIGAKGSMDFIQLQNYVSVNAYDRSKITLDLSQEPLYLTPEVFMAMNIPAGANFSMQLFFEAPGM